MAIVWKKADSIRKCLKVRSVINNNGNSTNLEDLTDCRECWKNIKFEKSNFTPNFYSMKGRPMEIESRILKKRVRLPITFTTNIGGQTKFQRRLIILSSWSSKTFRPKSEFSKALKSQKQSTSWKQIKRLGQTVQLWNFSNILDSSNVDSLTNCLNALWRAKLVPDDFTQAHIASLYKKGDHENPENYRPISLLNVSYKIYAYILKSRLAMALEEHLSPTQFGFRSSRSTIDPLLPKKTHGRRRNKVTIN